MRAPLAALLPLALLVPLAGCLDGGGTERVSLEPNGVPAQERVPGTYWMVWVHGEERAGREAPDYACDVAFDHAVDRGNRTVRYLPVAQSGDRGAVQVLLAFDVWEAWSGCPVWYALRWDAPLRQERLGRYGPLDLEVRDDGAVVVEGTRVPLGQAAVLRYEGTRPSEEWPRVQVEGEVRIENLGAWPRTGLLPE